MRVELLPAEVVSGCPEITAAVDPDGPTVLINPTIDVARILDEIAVQFPQVAGDGLVDSVLAALRAHEVEELEIAVALAPAANPNEVTDVHLKPLRPGQLVAAGARPVGTGYTAPINRVVDPGITADDVPPYPPGPGIRPSRLSLLPVLVGCALVIAAFGIGGQIIDIGPARPALPPAGRNIGGTGAADTALVDVPAARTGAQQSKRTNAPATPPPSIAPSPSRAPTAGPGPAPSPAPSVPLTGPAPSPSLNESPPVIDVPPVDVPPVDVPPAAGVDLPPVDLPPVDVPPVDSGDLTDPVTGLVDDVGGTLSTP